MTDEDGEGVGGGEGEAGTTDWIVRAGPRNKITRRDREEHEATHMLFRDWCTHCMMGRGRIHHVSKKRSEDLSRRPIIAMDNISSRPNSNANELSDDTRRVGDVHCVQEDRQTSEHHEKRSSEEGNRKNPGQVREWQDSSIR